MKRAWPALAMAAAAWGHDPITTKLLWTQEISRLIYRHCASCHREGGTAMPLVTYDEARPWAKAIRDEVTSRRMPPWGPVKGVGEFRDDPSLSQIEIDMIVNWVEGGAPEGDPAYLPSPPHFAPQPETAAAARQVTVTSAAPFRLSAAATLRGITPSRLAEGDWLEVSALLPQGGVRRLIWIRQWRPEWQRTFYLLHPMALPAGTRLRVSTGKPGAAVVLLGSG